MKNWSAFLMFASLGFMLVFAGCTNNQIAYYTNPYVLFGDILSEQEVEIGDYKILQYGSKLKIESSGVKLEVHLPYHGEVQSFHLSNDQRYLAFDFSIDNGLKIFVVNLESGEYENISETIGYQSDYDGYQVPHGLAWSPKENIIAFIVGYYDLVNVNLYHLDMDLNKQGRLGSEVYSSDVYGVKWAADGDSIYYVLDNYISDTYIEDGDYLLYQTEITSNDHLLGGEIIKKDELTNEELKQWLLVE